MSDLISRQAAIEAIQREARIAGGIVAIEYADMFEYVLKQLPSAEVTLCHLDSPCEYQNADIAMPSAQQWIPVSEAMPEEGKQVLVCDDFGNIYIAEYETLTDGEWRWVETVGYRYLYGVKAWMPLPEPWEGEG